MSLQYTWRPVTTHDFNNNFPWHGLQMGFKSPSNFMNMALGYAVKWPRCALTLQWSIDAPCVAICNFSCTFVIFEEIVTSMKLWIFKVPNPENLYISFVVGRTAWNLSLVCLVRYSSSHPCKNHKHQSLLSTTYTEPHILFKIFFICDNSIS